MPTSWCSATCTDTAEIYIRDEKKCRTQHTQSISLAIPFSHELFKVILKKKRDENHTSSSKITFIAFEWCWRSKLSRVNWRQVHWVLAKRYFHISESINMCDSVTCWQTVTTHAKTVGITDIFPFIDSLAITITVFTSIECEWMCENAFTRMTVWNVIEYYHITYRLASSARMNRRIFLINSNVSGSKMWRSMYRSILTSSSGWRPRILFINWCTLLRLTFVSE